MAAKRLSMRKIREVLRLKHEFGLSNRDIAKSCSIGAHYGERLSEPVIGRWS